MVTAGLSPEEAAQLAGVNWYALLMAGAHEDSYQVQAHAVCAAVCPAAPDSPMANVVTYRDPEGLWRGLEDAEGEYRSAGITTASLWEWSGSDRDELAARGWHHAERMPGMTIELAELQTIPLDGLEVRTSKDMGKLGELNELVYPEHGAGLARALEQFPADLDGLIYEGLVDGEVVSCVCMAYPRRSKDVTGFWLATHPEARGQRAGRKVWQVGLAEAAQAGRVTASLQGSTDGVPIYRKMGFRELGERWHQEYVWRAEAAR